MQRVNVLLHTLAVVLVIFFSTVKSQSNVEFEAKSIIHSFNQTQNRKIDKQSIPYSNTMNKSPHKKNIKLMWNRTSFKNRISEGVFNTNNTFDFHPLQERLESGWDTFTTHIGDVNSDGNTDIIWNEVTTTNNRTCVGISKGDGTFDFKPMQKHGGCCWENFKTLTADVNGDGNTDLIWNSLTSKSNRTFVGLSMGDGTFELKEHQDHLRRYWEGFTILSADVNGDGKDDLIWNVTGATLNRTYVGLSNGDGTFEFMEYQDHLRRYWRGFTALTADVNGDGKDDLIWNTTTLQLNRTYVGLSNGDGTFEFKQYQDHDRYYWKGFKMLTGDMNGDGRDDLVWNILSKRLNRTYIGISQGDGTFELREYQDHSKCSWEGFTIHIADVNTDGTNDLIWNKTSKTLNRTYIGIVNGEGTIQYTEYQDNTIVSDWDTYECFVGELQKPVFVNVVWWENDGNDAEIFLWNGDSISQLTHNNYHDFDPQVSGNRVVWMGGDDGSGDGIHMWDGTSITKLTNNIFYDCEPQISGNNVVWTRYYSYEPGTNSDIYLWDGKSEIQISDNDFIERSPKISGNNIVWEKIEGNDHAIYFWNGTKETKITSGPRDFFYNFKISGNNVVWQEYDGNDLEIYFWNGISITQITNNEYEDCEPHISGNNVVWQGYEYIIDEGEIFYFNHHIYLWNGQTVLQITKNSTNDFSHWNSPQISGNNVVFVGNGSSGSEVFFWDGNATTQVTTNLDYSTIYYPKISGNSVVWLKDGNNTGIFFWGGNSVLQVAQTGFKGVRPQISEFFNIVF